MDFKKIELSDREWMDKRLMESDFCGSEYCFSNSYNWRSVYGVEVCQTNGMLVIKCVKPSTTYAYPAGAGDLQGSVAEIIADAEQSGVPFVLTCIQNEGKVQLEKLFPGVFEFFHDRDNIDYIYESASLISLAGKKLQSKRNHINKFKESFPDWCYEAITADNLKDCEKMTAEWCVRYGCKDSEGLTQESCAVKSAFANFEALGLTGGLLRCTPQGEVVAYAMGTRLNSDTFIVHIEKAYHDIQGAYPLINQQFAEHNCSGFTYINREDDTGSEGLRKAKLSYRPALLPDKYHALLRRQL